MGEYPKWFKNIVAEHKAEGLKAGNLVGVAPHLFRLYMNHLSKYVVHDKTAKSLTFLTGISAYTQHPINLFLKGESSIGKTYNVTQALKYFPQTDVLMLGGLSPTAFYHDFGVLQSMNGDPIDFSERPSSKKPRKRKKEGAEEYQRRVELWQADVKRWNELIQNSRYVVDLQNKILVFLESPHIETYNKLRPILSHDRQEISYKFTDKRGGQLRTMHVVVRGFPATIFLTTQEDYVEDLATRSITHTPETHQTKIHDANVLQGTQRALPWKYEDDKEWMLLHGYIGFLSNHIREFGVVNPYGREFGEAYPSTVPRYMRDFKHILSLIETSALFHAFQRPVLCVGDKKFVMCTLEDLNLVSKIIPEVEETTTTGLPSHVLECFHKVIEPLYGNGGAFDYETLTCEYNKAFVRKRSSATLRGYVMLLRQVGWVDTMRDPTDKRKTLITVIEKNGENTFDSVVNEFLEVFTLEKLKSWLDETKKCVFENTVVLRDKIISEAKANIEDIYNLHYSPTLLSLEKTDFTKQISNITSEPFGELKSEKTIETSAKTQSNALLQPFNPLPEGDLLDVLRKKWSKGFQQDFIKLIEQVGRHSPEDSEKLFEKWIDKDGIVAYDPDGYLCWTD